MNIPDEQKTALLIGQLTERLNLLEEETHTQAERLRSQEILINKLLTKTSKSAEQPPVTRISEATAETGLKSAQDIPNREIKKRANRRSLLKLAGATLAAATVSASTIFSLPPQKAEANDGDFIQIGHPNNATSTTFIVPYQNNSSPLFWVDSTNGFGGSTTALQASSKSGSALYAYSLYDGQGVYAESKNGNAIYATSFTDVNNNPTGYAGVFEGGLAPIRVVPGSTPGAPGTGSHAAGEIYVDNNSGFWISQYGSSGITFNQLATTDQGLKIFSSSQRVYKQTSNVPGIVNDISAIYDLSFTGTGIPVGAKAAYCAVQGIPKSGTPTMTLFPSGGTDSGSANWAGSTLNVLNLIYMFVPLNSSGNFSIHSYFKGAVFVDVWGYFS